MEVENTAWHVSRTALRTKEMRVLFDGYDDQSAMASIELREVVGISAISLKAENPEPSSSSGRINSRRALRPGKLAWPRRYPPIDILVKN
jgi:hypothetical protein